MNTVEFFQDATCGWCYLLSPRIRRVSKKFNVKVIHSSHVSMEYCGRFQSTPETIQEEKQVNLQRWEYFQWQAEDPSRFNIEGMRKTQFKYPSGYNASLAAIAVEFLCGSTIRWRYFDEVQIAHFQNNQNISSFTVLTAIAEQFGINKTQFQTCINSTRVREQIFYESNRKIKPKVSSLPAILINEELLVTKALSQLQLTKLFQNINSENREEKNAYV